MAEMSRSQYSRSLLADDHHSMPDKCVVVMVTGEHATTHASCEDDEAMAALKDDLDSLMKDKAPDLRVTTVLYPVNMEDVGGCEGQHCAVVFFDSENGVEKIISELNRRARRAWKLPPQNIGATTVNLPRAVVLQCMERTSRSEQDMISFMKSSFLVRVTKSKASNDEWLTVQGQWLNVQQLCKFVNRHAGSRQSERGECEDFGKSQFKKVGGKEVEKKRRRHRDSEIDGDSVKDLEKVDGDGHNVEELADQGMDKDAMARSLGHVRNSAIGLDDVQSGEEPMEDVEEQLDREDAIESRQGMNNSKMRLFDRSSSNKEDYVVNTISGHLSSVNDNDTEHQNIIENQLCDAIDDEDDDIQKERNIGENRSDDELMDELREWAQTPGANFAALTGVGKNTQKDDIAASEMRNNASFSETSKSLSERMTGRSVAIVHVRSNLSDNEEELKGNIDNLGKVNLMDTANTDMGLIPKRFSNVAIDESSSNKEPVHDQIKLNYLKVMRKLGSPQEHTINASQKDEKVYHTHCESKKYKFKDSEDILNLFFLYMFEVQNLKEKLESKYKHDIVVTTGPSRTNPSFHTVYISGNDDSTVARAKKRLLEQREAIRSTPTKLLTLANISAVEKEIETIKHQFKNTAINIDKESAMLEIMGEDVDKVVAMLEPKQIIRRSLTSTTESSKVPEYVERMLQPKIDWMFVQHCFKNDIEKISRPSVKMEAEETDEGMVEILFKGNFHAKNVKHKIEELFVKVDKDLVHETIKAVDVFEVDKGTIDRYNGTVDGNSLAVINKEFVGKEATITVIGSREEIEKFKTYLKRFMKLAEPKPRGRVRKLYVADDTKATKSESSSLSPEGKSPNVRSTSPEARSYKAHTVHTSGGDKWVHVLVYDITKLKVDAIVNAANGNLIHGGGVAAAIARAAGPRLERECDDHIRMLGRSGISVTHNYISGPGNLPCKAVIHAVGPVRKNYKDLPSCERDLRATVERCLKDAALRYYTSIAIPAISSGIFGVPVLSVASVLGETVTKYLCSTQPPSSLRNVYLVDVIPDTVRLIQTVMDRQYSNMQQYTFQGLPGYPPHGYPPHGPPPPGAAGFQPHLQMEQQQQQQYLQHMTGPGGSQQPPAAAGAGNHSFPDRNGGMSQAAASSSTMYPGYGSSGQPPYGHGPQYGNSANNGPTYLSNPPNSGPGQYGAAGTYNSPGFNPATGVGQVADTRMMPGANSDPEWPPLPGLDDHWGSNLPDIRTETRAEKSPATTTSDRDCPICLDKPTFPVSCPQCKHPFCKTCLDASLASKPVCPTCGHLFRALTGNQPKDGKMAWEVTSRSLAGHEGQGTIVIRYMFPSGVQGPEHPNPGVHYHGIQRTAYLPASPEGHQVLRLLIRAFEARLTFTIGRSVTTGLDNQITWNDIHHKTNMTGGQQGFGYPDPTYLSRVREELAAKGIK